jgi:large subunit ribosomal protein L29
MKASEELKELKLKSAKELNKILISSREKLGELKFKVSQNQLKNIREIRTAKKKVAKLITLINQKRTETEIK